MLKSIWRRFDCGFGVFRTIFCVFIVTLFLFTRGGVAEATFHSRGREDRVDAHKSFEVSSTEDAEKYLVKYGYLDCSSSRGRHKRDLNIKEGGPTSDDLNCTEEEVRNAMEKLQATFHMKPSGKLDPETRKRMSAQRCGNKDDDVDQEFGTLGLAQRRDGNGNLPTPVPYEVYSPIHEGGDSTESELEGPSKRIRRSVIPVTEQDHNADNENAASKSLLSTIISPQKTQNDKYAHRKVMMQELNDRLRVEDAVYEATMKDKKPHIFKKVLDWFQTKHRSKRMRRSLSNNEGTIFTGELVQWKIVYHPDSTSLPASDQRSLFHKAFRMWSEIIPPVFKELRDDTAQVELSFGKLLHRPCNRSFDGKGGELAHSWTGGDIHFDAEEPFKEDSDSPNGVNLFKVAVHEIGHVLGLGHHSDRSSIMYPFFQELPSSGDFELSNADRTAIKGYYGTCKGRFDIVMDWLREKSGFDPTNPQYVFNTYFFRGSQYWMYENRYSRTRYGDPLYISNNWDNLPSSLDAYTQVSVQQGNTFLIDTYFFKGDKFYKFDNGRNEVMNGYPKTISSSFGSKGSGWDSIPNNLDAVHYHMASQKLYFFKDQWVWIYPASEIGKNKCCDQKILFKDLFRTSLTGYIDSVYYSYRHLSTFIFKGEDVYKIDDWTSSWRLSRIGKWYDNWFDICDVI